MTNSHRAPLFRDPFFDGATDPTVIRHQKTSELWMFYTQRRAHLDEPGVAWVHGSRIGVARSSDGQEWAYAGTLDGLDSQGEADGDNTHWAPEVIWDGEWYRMYLTVITGIPDRWDGHARHIVEYRSDDLWNWERLRVIPLGSDRVIDACVARCPDGRWRLWYKDEAAESTTGVAVATRLDDPAGWVVDGQAIGGRPHEGPNVFALGGWQWMLVDEWRGMGVYRSADAVTWTRQGGPDEVILGEPGCRPGDGTVGRHGDVLVEGELAVLYYFTHPHWDGSEIATAPDAARARVSVVQAVDVTVRDGLLHVDRDECGVTCAA